MVEGHAPQNGCRTVQACLGGHARGSEKMVFQYAPEPVTVCFFRYLEGIVAPRQKLRTHVDMKIDWDESPVSR
jgi:hypothetical protein